MSQSRVPSVDVTCDAGTCLKPDGSPSLVTRFTASRAAHFVTSTDVEWTPSGLDTSSRARKDGADMRLHRRKDSTTLSGNRPLSLKEQLEIGSGLEYRNRHNIRCGDCGDAVTMRRESADKVFGTLFDNGVPAITLRGLRARVGGR